MKIQYTSINHPFLIQDSHCASRSMENPWKSTFYPSWVGKGSHAFSISFCSFLQGYMVTFPVSSTSSWHLLKYPVVFPENAAPVLQFVHFKRPLKTAIFSGHQKTGRNTKEITKMLGLKSLKRWPIGAGRPLAAMYNVPAMSREPTQPEFFEPHVMSKSGWSICRKFGQASGT